MTSPVGQVTGCRHQDRTVRELHLAANLPQHCGSKLAAALQPLLLKPYAHRLWAGGAKGTRRRLHILVNVLLHSDIHRAIPPQQLRTFLQ